YENDLIAMIFGENFHPGGEALTLHLGEKLELNDNSKVIDIACGAGHSAVALAKRFGCDVIGIDLSAKNLEKARKIAEVAGFSNKIKFIKSDAEELKFDNETFDAVICECALCTFPNQKTAVSEMYRVLKKGGKVGITDVIMEQELPDELKNIVFQVICIAGALTSKGYQQLFSDGGFERVQFEDHSYTIHEMLQHIEKMVMGLDLMIKLCDSDFGNNLGLTPERARELIKLGYDWLDKGAVGYGLFIGVK
ncbi:MAG: methyltransferase domain-containing protein, partial [Thermoplasmata archaeon]|nr:methyltransferase domain-containing protein [Thermoplasmata archaeon]